MELHDTIDNMEQRIREVLGAHAVIHMDPVVVDDERISRMRRITELIVKEIYSEITIHDFRMVAGPTHTNLIFDAVVPYEAQLSEEEAREKICEKVAQLPGKHYAVVKIDRPFY